MRLSLPTFFYRNKSKLFHKNRLNVARLKHGEVLSVTQLMFSLLKLYNVNLAALLTA